MDKYINLKIICDNSISNQLTQNIIHTLLVDILDKWHLHKFINAYDVKWMNTRSGGKAVIVDYKVGNYPETFTYGFPYLNDGPTQPDYNKAYDEAMKGI